MIFSLLLLYLVYWKFIFHSYFERQNDKFLTFHIVYFPNFEISASLYVEPHLTVSKFNKPLGALIGENMVHRIRHENTFSWGGWTFWCCWRCRWQICSWHFQWVVDFFLSFIPCGLFFGVLIILFICLFIEYAWKEKN